MRHTTFIVLLLLVFLSVDLAYSFLQFLQFPLDGDMAGGIVPASDVIPILNDPIGWKVISNKAHYPNPNRFFCHYPFYLYFNHIPQFLQSFFAPIHSVYIAVAIGKTLIQAGLIYLLAAIISGNKSCFSLRFLLSAVLISPLFQTNGYQGLMGIIDPAVTYAFFYALPCIFILAYFLPLFFNWLHNTPLPSNIISKAFRIVFAGIVALSGALNPGIILVISVLYGFHILIASWQQGQFNVNGIFKNISSEVAWLLIPAAGFAFYSLYLGTFNAVNAEHPYTILELYSRIPKGLAIMFTEKIGPPLLLVFILINTLIIRFTKQIENKKKLLLLLNWIIAFSLIYTLLLPFGGYRTYRPNVVRYDTFLPVMLALITYFGISTIHILSTSFSRKLWYGLALSTFLIVFILADEPEFNKNKCEKDALYTLSLAQKSPVLLEQNCRVASWQIITNPDESNLNATLFYRWNITKQINQYYSNP